MSKSPLANGRRPFSWNSRTRLTSDQAKRLRAQQDAARQLYNAILSDGQRRLRRMRADPAWQSARAIARTQKLERKRAFGELRQRYGISLVRAARGRQRLELHVDR